MAQPMTEEELELLRSNQSPPAAQTTNMFDAPAEEPSSEATESIEPEWSAASAPPAAQLSAPKAEPPAVLPAPTKPAPKPAQRPRAAASAEPAFTGDIEDKAFNAKAGAKSLAGDMAAGQNRQLDLVEQTKGGIASEGAARQGALEGELRGEQREGRLEAKERVAKNREEKDAFEQRMNARLDSLSDSIRNPPKDTMGMVMGLIGMAMSAKGNQKGAVMAQGLGQMMGSKMKKWQAGIEADQAEFKGLRDMFQMQNADSESELGQEAKMSALAAAEFDSALKQVASETQSTQAKAEAEQARLLLRQQFVAHQQSVNQRQAAAGQENQLYRLIASEADPARRAALAANYGEAGQKVLASLQKTDANAANIDKTAADIEHTRADTAAGPGGVAGAGKMTEGQQKARALYEASAADAARVDGALKEGTPGWLGAKLASSGWVPDALIPQSAIEAYRSAEAVVNDDLRDESGAAIGPAEKEGLLAPLRSTDENIRRQGYLRIQAKRDAMGGKLRPGEAPAQAGGDGKVDVVSPSGQTMRVAPDTARALMKSSGYRPVEGN